MATWTSPVMGSVKYRLTYSTSMTNDRFTFTATKLELINQMSNTVEHPQHTIEFGVGVTVIQGTTIPILMAITFKKTTLTSKQTKTVWTGTKTETPYRVKTDTAVSLWNNTSYKLCTIPALPSYTITYNANKGTNPPANQKKWYGENINVSAQRPNRDRFTFVTWNTSSDGTGTNYDPGQAITVNSALTLYAIWHALPEINTLIAYRCNTLGEQDDNGNSGYIECSWSIDSSEGAIATLTGTITPQVGGTSTPFLFYEGSQGADSGIAKAIIDENNGQFIDNDMQYLIAISATSGPSTVTRDTIITRTFFVMDWKAGGQAVGIGTAAPVSGLEIGYSTTCDGFLLLRDDGYLNLSLLSELDEQIYNLINNLNWGDVIDNE